MIEEHRRPGAGLTSNYPGWNNHGHGIGRSVKVVWLVLADLLLSAETEIERRSPSWPRFLLLVLALLLGSIGNFAARPQSAGGISRSARFDRSVNPTPAQKQIPAPFFLGLGAQNPNQGDGRAQKNHHLVPETALPQSSRFFYPNNPNNPAGSRG